MATGAAGAQRESKLTVYSSGNGINMQIVRESAQRVRKCNVNPLGEGGRGERDAEPELGQLRDSQLSAGKSSGISNRWSKQINFKLKFVSSFGNQYQRSLNGFWMGCATRQEKKQRRSPQSEIKSSLCISPSQTRRQHLRMPTTLCLMSQAKLVGTQKQLHEHPVHPVEAKQHNNNHFCLPVAPSRSVSTTLSHCVEHRPFTM